NYFLGPALFIWLSGSIYHQIQKQPNLEASWQEIRASFGSPRIINLIIVIALMFVNWGIEAYKWKLTIRNIQKVNFFTACKAILSGVSFSVTTPNRIGEYLGRILYMEQDKRIKAISLTIVGSMSQLIITLVTGLAGLLVIMPELEKSQTVSSLWLKVILYGVLAVLVVLTLLYFRLPWLVRWVDRFPATQRFRKWIVALEECTPGLLFKLLGLSALRYIVFAIQYLLLFSLFKVEIATWDACWAVSVSFLVLAIIPTFAIAEVAQRGYITKTIVGLYSLNQAGILFATVSIWFINLVVPAIAGSLLIAGKRKILQISASEKN
ncbi:MAG TPA: lysylphosphatidylglycerol synthase domain-containing protein, partial [Chitinophagaceae bacterium]|nr:lysylphosphatidylglycerol synthase domain-containing protein [Chitinophagaceae bacterium]